VDGLHFTGVGGGSGRHSDVAPGALLSVNTIAVGPVGHAPPPGQQGSTRLRLFFSPVKPSAAQEGLLAEVIEESQLMIGTIVPFGPGE
jgi:hypothetical protein